MLFRSSAFFYSAFFVYVFLLSFPSVFANFLVYDLSFLDNYFLKTITLNLSKSVSFALLAFAAAFFAVGVSAHFLSRPNFAIAFLRIPVL